MLYVGVPCAGLLDAITAVHFLLLSWSFIDTVELKFKVITCIEACKSKAGCVFTALFVL